MIKYIKYLLLNIFRPLFIFKMEKRIGKKIDGDIDEFKGAIKSWIEHRDKIPRNIRVSPYKFKII